jgi:hypothetical protein
MCLNERHVFICSSRPQNPSQFITCGGAQPAERNVGLAFTTNDLLLSAGPPVVQWCCFRVCCGSSRFFIVGLASSATCLRSLNTSS